MRAAILHAYNSPLGIEDVPMPACPADGVVLRVLACGICRSDWHGWTGEHARVKPGSRMGHEYCGEVVEAGPQARWRRGERVIAPFILACGSCPDCQAGHQTACGNQIVPGFTAPGAFAEYVAVPHAHNLARLPEALDPALAAGLGCRVTTAWEALTGRAALQAGEWLAIHGTGGVGMSALILARAIGARVIVTDVVPQKLAFARDLGAEHALDARAGDTAERIRDLTGGGAHVSVDALGFPETIRASLASLRRLGRHVQVGMPTGHHARIEIDMLGLYSGQLAVFGTRGMPSWKYPPLLDLVSSGRVDVRPLLAREVRLSDVSAELAAMNGPTPPGVAVVTDFAN
ncbi:MAG: alcohol dehydrogenase catalytic domain-containing protein [Rubellimicrobium sp.]|nr:alcohol dehydrogenase catalytic domain-containing protein [Rubellimicrobium sp.]